MSVESTYVTLQNKKWRAITYNYVNLMDGLSEGSKLYCLTDFQRTWLMSNIDYMRFPTRWTNLSITKDELNQLADDLELALMSCVDIQPYQVEFTYNQTVKQTLDNFQSAYDLGGISELNPNTPTDFYDGDGSDNRESALCTACKIYVYSYAANWVTVAQTTLGIAVLFGIAASLSIVGGIIASVLVGGLAFITQTAIDAMTDEDALDNVACCMYNALQGQVVGQSIFENSLDACGFLVGSNESIVRDIISADLDKFKNWLSFLNSVGDSFVYAEAGISDCPCPDICTQLWDFTINDQGWTFATVAGLGTPLAQYTTAWTHANVGTSDDKKQIHINGFSLSTCNGNQATITVRANTSAPQLIERITIFDYIGTTFESVLYDESIGWNVPNNVDHDIVLTIPVGIGDGYSIRTTWNNPLPNQQFIQKFSVETV